jgi:hypothetical protein
MAHCKLTLGSGTLKTDSRQWHTAKYSCPKKARMSKLKIKPMLICCFGSRGISYKQFVSQYKLSIYFYQEILERLRISVARVRLGIARSWMLHHNAPCHTAVYINQSLADKSIPVVSHSSVCRISVAVNYFYFPASKAT